MYLCSHSGGHFFLHTPQIRSFICHRCRQSFTNYNPPMPRTSSARNWYINHDDPERPKNPWRCILETCSFTVCGECAEIVQAKLKRLKKVADLKIKLEKAKEGREAGEVMEEEGEVSKREILTAHNESNGDNEAVTSVTESERASQPGKSHGLENSSNEEETDMTDLDLSEWPDLSLFDLDAELKRDILAPEIRRAIAIPRGKKTSGEESPAVINGRPREGEKRKEMAERREERTRPPPQASHVHKPSTTSIISSTTAQPQQIQHASTEMEVMEVEVDDGSGDEYNIEFLRMTTRSAASAAAEAGMNARARVRRTTMLDRRERENRDNRVAREPKVRRMEGME
ncbi:hypothetical protein BZA77DRAFT_88013 [Pyronema omphalodes]|nr:hypothetical protein BZA77DRAFT_88013 [Pyronema omphalodes]